MGLGRLDVLFVGTDVADVREGEGDDLPRVGGIGHHLLVSGHGGVEAQLADRLALGAEAPAPDRPAVGENDDSRRARPGCWVRGQWDVHRPSAGRAFPL